MQTIIEKHKEAASHSEETAKLKLMLEKILFDYRTYFNEYCVEWLEICNWNRPTHRNDLKLRKNLIKYFGN